MSVDSGIYTAWQHCIEAESAAESARLTTPQFIECVIEKLIDGEFNDDTLWYRPIDCCELKERYQEHKMKMTNLDMN